jgi:hypothetical protein
MARRPRRQPQREPAASERSFKPPPPRWRLPVRQPGFWAGIALGLGLSAAILVLHFTRGTSSPSTDAPWGPATAGLRQRLSALGLPPLPLEGRALHIHEHLDIYLDGRHVAVPANIGINRKPLFFSPLHTHDRTGILHVESPDRRTYTLGQFFGVWGVRLSDRCIGDFCAGRGRSLVAFVNGEGFAGNPAQIPLRRHAEIVLAYGTRAQLPQSIPSSYSFPSGY